MYSNNALVNAFRSHRASQWNPNITVQHQQDALLSGMVVDAAGFWMVVRPPSHSPMKVAFRVKLCSQGISAKPQRFVFAAVFGEPQRSLTSSAWLRAGGAPDGSAALCQEEGLRTLAAGLQPQPPRSDVLRLFSSSTNRLPDSNLHQKNTKRATMILSMKH